MIALTYVEALGLSFFSRRRGWRIGLGRAERVACYASVGWLPAVAALAGVHALEQGGVFASLWGAWIGPWTHAAELGVLVAAGGVVMLWFEWLCWLGARRIRYANDPPRPCRLLPPRQGLAPRRLPRPRARRAVRVTPRGAPPLRRPTLHDVV